jgi:hypothetical protein
VAIGAGAAVLVVAAGWALTHRPHVLVPTDGKVSVQVPGSWKGSAGFPYPGETDADAGARAGQGDRSITVAYSSSYEPPEQVAARVQVTGCAAPTARTVTVDAWQGVVWHYAGCAAGIETDEVVLANQGSREWTVWIEVRSSGGDPDLGSVLKTLKVAP